MRKELDLYRKNINKILNISTKSKQEKKEVKGDMA